MDAEPEAGEEILDHGITAEEAAGPKSDLLYRWGNPFRYGMGEWEKRRLMDPRGTPGCRQPHPVRQRRAPARMVERRRVVAAAHPGRSLPASGLGLEEPLHRRPGRRHGALPNALFRATRYAADHPGIVALRAKGAPIPEGPGTGPATNQYIAPQEEEDEDEE